jgi:PHD/YefM family antitoxin component YafN of YafNO toxin-antitoxin module
MRTITASKARENLFKIINNLSEESEPLQITGKKANAVLISENDWRDISETLYLTSIPGMRESIIEGMKIPIEECSEGPAW